MQGRLCRGEGAVCVQGVLGAGDLLLVCYGQPVMGETMVVAENMQHAVQSWQPTPLHGWCFNRLCCCCCCAGMACWAS